MHIIEQSNSVIPRDFTTFRRRTFGVSFSTKPISQPQGGESMTNGLTNEFDTMFTHRVYIQTLHLIKGERTYVPVPPHNRMRNRKSICDLRTWWLVIKTFGNIAHFRFTPLKVYFHPYFLYEQFSLLKSFLNFFTFRDCFLSQLYKPPPNQQMGWSNIMVYIQGVAFRHTSG